MIPAKVEIYSLIEQQYYIFEALVDTGVTICAIAEHIAKSLGLTFTEVERHLWQVRDPLVLKSATLNIRYEGKTHDVEAVVISIPEQFRRTAIETEKCKRPKYANPLSTRVILGENFFAKLSPQEKKKIGLL